MVNQNQHPKNGNKNKLTRRDKAGLLAAGAVLLVSAGLAGRGEDPDSPSFTGPTGTEQPTELGTDGISARKVGGALPPIENDNDDTSSSIPTVEVTVKKDDNAWNLAQTYSGEGEDFTQKVDDIMQQAGADGLQPGEKIEIPTTEGKG